MALPASDTFVGAAGTDLPVYSANWDQTMTGTNTLELNGSGACSASTANDCANGWVGDAFNADHWSEVIMDPVSATERAGTAARCGAASSRNLYGAYANQSSIEIFKQVGATWTQLGATITGLTWTSGSSHTLRLTVVGTLLTLDYDLASTTRTDSAHSTGKAGVCAWRTQPDILSWSADNVATATPSALPRRRNNPQLTFR